MAEYKKRETAHKLRIGEILSGTPIVEDVVQEAAPDSTQTVAPGATKERFRFLEIGEKRIIRVNIVANVIETYNSEGEKKYSSVTIDDATGQIRIKAFGEDTGMLTTLGQGDTITVIGVLRSYNRELYIMPEIIKKADPRYLLVRKLELEGGKAKSASPNTGSTANSAGQVVSLRDQIIEIIKSAGDSGGVSTESIILKIQSSPPEAINSEITKLLEDGMIYEPRPSMVRWLG
jgi:RPA family protein